MQHLWNTRFTVVPVAPIASCSPSGFIPENTNISCTHIDCKQLFCFTVVPVAPTASCSPSGFIPENTNINCTCHTENVGTPLGTLMWFRGTGNSINFSINNGKFGDSTLQMEPQKVVRADLNSKKFRCDVDWNNKRFSGDAFTVSVGCKSHYFCFARDFIYDFRLKWTNFAGLMTSRGPFADALTLVFPWIIQQDLLNFACGYLCWASHFLTGSDDLILMLRSWMCCTVTVLAVIFWQFLYGWVRLICSYIQGKGAVSWSH